MRDLSDHKEKAHKEKAHKDKSHKEKSELQEKKRQLRERVLLLRDAIPEPDRMRCSRQIAEKILDLPQMRESRHVLCYKSFRSEVDTSYLIDACVRQKKTVYLPRIVRTAAPDGAKKREMKFYRFDGWPSLVQGTWGIWEPPENPAFEFSYEKAAPEGCFAILPGTVFDKNCIRMGYGGGFYDRFLSEYPQLWTCGICFSCQIADRVPAGIFDLRPDMVVTETAVYHS